MTDQTAATGSTGENLSLRESESIQGNVLAPFAKDHMTFLLYSFPAGGGDAARAWLADLVPRIATTRQVTTFNDEFSRARKARGGDDPSALKAVWRGVSFTSQGLHELAPQHAADVDRFVSFTAGSAKQAGILNDVDVSAPETWVFGGPTNPVVHAVVTVAADESGDLELERDKLGQLAARHRLTLAYELRGDTLPDSRRGHEHFGFKDGISQPGVAGYTPTVTDNERVEDRDHPGSEVLPAGRFVLGLEGGEDIAPPAEVLPSPYGPPASPTGGLPDWLRNGTFQVLRRLKQDVPAWWAQVEARSREASPDGTLSPDALAAKAVGRWRSGTPTARAPLNDNRSSRARGDDNDFTYADDPEGHKTPRFAHIRKVYPRDDERFQDDRHRMLRRGIPFGPVFDPASGRGHGVDADRGLLFNIFVASIENQFEFVQQKWANEANFQAGSTPPDGPDPVIGNSSSPVTLQREGQSPVALDFRRFVSTTGSIYAFVPSMETLAQLAEGGL